MMYIVIPIILVLIDQITKFLAIEKLQGNPPIKLIGDFLQLNFVKNFGAAFGIMQNQKWIFVVITVLTIVGIYVFLFKTKESNLIKIPLLLIVGGAIGNLIDRIRFGYVVDFIDVKFGKLYDFPVFNAADCFIVVGCFVMILVVLLSKEESF